MQGIESHRPAASASELETILDDLRKTFIVLRIMTPRDRFHYLEDVDLENEEAPFDVLPDRALTSYWYAKDGRIHRITAQDVISGHTDLLTLVDCFEEKDFYFVKSGREIDGIVHFSDLQKYFVRVMFFTIISALETKLAVLYTDRDSFVENALSEKRKEQIEQLRDEDRRRNQDLGITEYLNFSDYLTLLARDQDFLESTGYTRSLFKREFNPLVALRNWCAHPTRTSIDGIREFLITRKERLLKLYSLIQEYSKRLEREKMEAVRVVEE